LSIYDETLATWELSDDEEKVSIAINLRHDHRVSETREQRFRDYFLRRNDLREALDDYVWESVKQPPSPHFCERWCDNLVADWVSGECCENFDRDTDLVTVLNLNGLSRPVKDTYPNLVDVMPEWRELINVETQASDEQSSGALGQDKFDRWVENNLKDKMPREVESFLEKIFKLLNHRLTVESKYYNPVWVTTWEIFEEYANQGADRWNQVVGVPREMPTWQIVLRYPASKVPCLYRPSQLDGGYYPQHFPSPPVTAKAEGGLTMDLGASVSRPLNEYIHKQIELSIDYWIAGGRLIGKTGFTPYELPQVRTHHYERLIGKHDEEVIRNWMSRPF
jgi:hypothetical protein